MSSSAPGCPLSCEEARDLLPEVLPALRRETVEVQEHLRGCAECAEEAEELTLALALLRDAAPDLPASMRGGADGQNAEGGDFAARVLAALPPGLPGEARSDSTPVALPASGARQPRGEVIPAFVNAPPSWLRAAAAALLFGAGFAVHGLLGELGAPGAAGLAVGPPTNVQEDVQQVPTLADPAGVTSVAGPTEPLNERGEAQPVTGGASEAKRPTPHGGGRLVPVQEPPATERPGSERAPETWQHAELASWAPAAWSRDPEVLQGRLRRYVAEASLVLHTVDRLVDEDSDEPALLAQHLRRTALFEQGERLLVAIERARSATSAVDGHALGQLIAGTQLILRKVRHAPDEGAQTWGVLQEEVRRTGILEAYRELLAADGLGAGTGAQTADPASDGPGALQGPL